MQIESAIEVEDQDTRNRSITTLENERKKSREETLRWISHYALSKVRLAWRGQSSMSMFADNAS